MERFSIKGLDGEVRFELECANLTECLEAAVEKQIPLTDCDFRGIQLIGTYLRAADFSGSSFAGSYLVNVDFCSANLSNTNFSSAVLKNVFMVGANIQGANLQPVKDDLWSILDKAPAEVPGLITALKEGRIDGRVYVGPCACLVGTIANIRSVHYRELLGIKPDSSRPAENFFLSIFLGETPETNPFSKLAVEWCEEWIAARPWTQESATGKTSNRGPNIQNIPLNTEEALRIREASVSKPDNQDPL